MTKCQILHSDDNNVKSLAILCVFSENRQAKNESMIQWCSLLKYWKFKPTS